jgi:hypothetical protein
MSVKRIILSAVVAVLCGCNLPCPQPKPVVDNIPDCVNDPFNYDFYSNEDQKRLTYCYAVLQTMAKKAK